jgi:hypothetical protein
MLVKLCEKEFAQLPNEREKPLFFIDVAVVKAPAECFIASLSSSNRIHVVYFAGVKACAEK